MELSPEHRLYIEVFHGSSVYPVMTLSHEWMKYGVICPKCKCCARECVNDHVSEWITLWRLFEDILGLDCMTVADRAYRALSTLASIGICSSDHPLMWPDGIVAKKQGQFAMDTSENRLISLATHLRVLMLRALSLNSKGGYSFYCDYRNAASSEFQ